MWLKVHRLLIGLAYFFCSVAGFGLYIEFEFQGTWMYARLARVKGAGAW